MLLKWIHNDGGGIALTNKGNNDQAAPVLTDALLYSNRIHVDGSLAVAAGTSYIVQYFGTTPRPDRVRRCSAARPSVPNRQRDGNPQLHYVAIASGRLDDHGGCQRHGNPAEFDRPGPW